MLEKKQRIVYAVIAAAIVLIALVYWLFFASFSSLSKNSYVYIDKDDTADSVFVKLKEAAKPHQMVGMRTCAALLGYKSHVHGGRYEVGDGIGTFRLFRNLRGGRQSAVSLVIPVAHTLNDLAAKLSSQLEIDSATLYKAMLSDATLKTLNTDTANVACFFIPNTYEVFWNISPDKLMQRMKKEHDNFWTSSRQQQAKAMGLTTNEVYALASIVEQESNNEAERPMIAGMYLNRLHQGMKLQADPTVKFALGNFSIRRIMINHLGVDSPYNTYKYEGLPIGPICIPSLNAINSVLNYAHHSYIYMCAKEDFSGTHNFATTYSEHMANAKRYADALNQRGVK